MFSPKKKVSKADLKKSIVSANEKLRSANSLLEKSIKENEVKLKNIKKVLTDTQEELVDTKDLKKFAVNELDSLQADVFNSREELRALLGKITSLKEESEGLKNQNALLEREQEATSEIINELNSDQEKLESLLENLDSLKQEEAKKMKKLEDISLELTELENGVDYYKSKKVSEKEAFQAFMEDLEVSRRKAELEVSDIKELSKKLKLSHGMEMGKLDTAIAERLTEINDMNDVLKKKDYEFVLVQSKITKIEDQLSDAKEEADYAVKKQQEKVGKIKKDFNNWKVEALEQVAKLKLRGKIENIDKAGLKEVLNG